MGSNWNFVLVTLAVAAAAYGQEGQYSQDGPFWVRTVTKEAPAHSQLVVNARARIVLRGGTEPKIIFKVVQRVRARTESQAQQLMPGVAGVTETFGDFTRVTVTPLSGPVSTVLEVYVPRTTVVARLESQGGNIEAYDYDGSIDASTMYGQIRCDRIAGNFSGRTGGGPIRLGKIGGSIRCTSGGGAVYVGSAGGETNCATAGGDMVVEESRGPLLLSTEGNIRVGKAASSVEAHSAAGGIQVGSAAGPVNADTRGGWIQVGSARGVRAESELGTVRVNAISGPMSVSTAVGSIFAELISGARLENSSLFAGQGDITVMIPSNVPVTVVARNDSRGPAKIISDFSEIRVMGGLLQSPASAQGAINGGGPVLFINAASGVIYLRKAK